MWPRSGNAASTSSLASQRLIDAALEARLQPERIDRAVRGLFEDRPESSAQAPPATSQMLAAAVPVGLAIGGFAVVPDATYAALTALIAIPFLCVTLLRLVALYQATAGSQRRARAEWPQAPACPDWLLPVYTVLVPLVREANVLPDLVASLRALDYPAAKLEIFLVLEAADAETQAAVLGLELPGNFRTVVVPDRAPHTKPKALNYALQFARGEYVVVYDAEDRPQPDQLRRAWEVFRHAPPELGCLQAQLNIYNPRQSWLTRQFTIEYSALFDAILPALERLRLPVPLGGTSNHFPRATLISVGAWDPYNVTEDADLGIRLARQGYRTGVLGSTTWEEAPPIFGIWIKQRTRWLKGWMQTYLVHTRDLHRLNRDLGWRAAIGLHVLMGGLIVSALVHPLFYALLARPLAGGRPAGAGGDVGRAGGVDHRLDQSRHLLRRLDSGRRPQRVAARPPGARHVRAADAALLASHLARRLPRRLPARAQPLPMGEDRARRRPAATQAALTRYHGGYATRIESSHAPHSGDDRPKPRRPLGSVRS